MKKEPQKMTKEQMAKRKRTMLGNAADKMFNQRSDYKK